MSISLTITRPQVPPLAHQVKFLYGGVGAERGSDVNDALWTELVLIGVQRLEVSVVLQGQRDSLEVICG